MRHWLALPALALLAACAAENAPEPVPTPTATVAEPRTLIPADFDPATLGARVAGMDVVDAEVRGRNRPLGAVTAYVACAKGIAVCDPAILPEGTVYTYVVTILPQDRAPQPATAGSEAEPAGRPATLTTIRPATGFNGAAGFSLAEATAAFGDEDAVALTLDENRLVWTATPARGWPSGKPLTLWWQSTSPPTKPSAAYRIEHGDEWVELMAPFPAADKPVDPAPTR